MSSPILTKRYSPDDRPAWNDFIERSKNSTFLFKREYVDYHQDRFQDHSLLIYFEDKLVALLIANENGDRIESHGGLTYGGLILEPSAKLEQVLHFFYHSVEYYNRNGFRSIIYKSLPSYFATHPSNEELYALFLLNANLYRRETSTVLDRSEFVSVGRKSKGAFKIHEAKNPERFWNEILIPNLKDRFGAEPVHTISEMKLLMERFPGNIRLFEVYNNHDLIAGTVTYVTPIVAHLQYTSANQQGRDERATAALVHYLVKDVFGDKRYISFGTSNTDDGRSLNSGLVAWKENFGARTFVHDFYEIETSHYKLLEQYR